MRAYCEYRSSQGMVVNLAMSALETKYPELKYYHDTLGGDRIRALGYKEKALLNEVHTVKNSEGVRCELHGIIRIGDRLLTAEIQSILHNVYGKLGIHKPVKATDLRSSMTSIPSRYQQGKDARTALKSGDKAGMRTFLLKGPSSYRIIRCHHST